MRTIDRRVQAEIDEKLHGHCTDKGHDKRQRKTKRRAVASPPNENLPPKKKITISKYTKQLKRTWTRYRQFNKDAPQEQQVTRTFPRCSQRGTSVGCGTPDQKESL